jgi:hypothetical protein
MPASGLFRLCRERCGRASSGAGRRIDGQAAAIEAADCRSVRACRSTVQEPVNASTPITLATSKSGQELPVPKTPMTASITAMLPRASLREQIQTERMLSRRCESDRASAPRRRSRPARPHPRRPGWPVPGGRPLADQRLPEDEHLEAPMQAALKNAALERTDIAIPRTARLMA